MNDLANVLDVEFEVLCESLTVPDAVKIRAWNLCQEFLSKSFDVNSEKHKVKWFALALYNAVIDASMPYGPYDPHIDKQSPPCCTLTDILKKTNTSFMQFLDMMESWITEIHLSDAVKKHLSNIEMKYCIVCPLFHGFDRQWLTVFRDDVIENGNSNLPPFIQMDGTNYRKALCWVLFLQAKESLMDDGQDLVHAYHLLLSCLEFVLRRTPSFQLHQPFDMLRLNLAKNLDQNGYNVAILEKLAEIFQMKFDDLVAVQEETGHFFESLMNDAGDFDIEQLEASYLERYRQGGQLDELQFLLHDPHLLPPDKGPSSPVMLSNTMQQWKKKLSDTMEQQPSDLLKQCFRQCANNPEISIQVRLNEIKAKFLPKYTEVYGVGQPAGVSELRFTQATNLYYRVMKMLLNMETERLSQTDLSSLLNNDSFHRSLFACSMEIILLVLNKPWNSLTNKTQSEDTSCGYLWILDVCSLHPYDFYKVFESFIRAEPNLPRCIIGHLTVIENKILDNMAWTSNSPVFEALSKSDSGNTLFQTINADITNGLASSSNTSSTTDLYLSPVRDQHKAKTSPVPGSFVSPRKASGVSVVYGKESPEPKTGIPKRSHSLNMFLNKVCLLGYLRLKELCDLLKVPFSIEQKIWTFFEFCITHRPDLMKDRHLDQIMMCSLYGICKVSDNEIKFKDIVKAYSTMPHAKPETYKHALIEPGLHDSIIFFYNKIFMQNMKNVILQFAKQVQSNLSPVPRPVTSPASPKVYSIPGRKNFYVSPLKDSPFKSPYSPSSMTPRSRQLYSFGEGPGSSEKLKNINESLSAFKLRNNLPCDMALQRTSDMTSSKRVKRLSFDALDDHNQNSNTNIQEDSDSSLVVKKMRVTNTSAVTSKSAKPINDVALDFPNSKS